MKYFWFLFFLQLNAFLFADKNYTGFYNERYLEIGAEIKEPNLIQYNKQILSSPGQFLPYFEMKKNEQLYKIAVKNNKVEVVFVNCILYKDNLISVGTKIHRLKGKLDTNRFKEIIGWGYVLTLENGWSIGVFTGSSGTDFYPNNDSEISFIYKE